MWDTDARTGMRHFIAGTHPGTMLHAYTSCDALLATRLVAKKVLRVYAYATRAAASSQKKAIMTNSDECGKATATTATHSTPDAASMVQCVMNQLPQNAASCSAPQAPQVVSPCWHQTNGSCTNAASAPHTSRTAARTPHPHLGHSPPAP